MTSTPGTRPRDHGIPTSDYLVDQSSRCLGVAVRVLPRSSDRRCTWMTIVVDRGTCEGAAGPDSPEIYRGCGWAPDTLAPAHFVGPLGQTRLGCNRSGTAMSTTGRAWLQLAQSIRRLMIDCLDTYADGHPRLRIPVDKRSLRAHDSTTPRGRQRPQDGDRNGEGAEGHRPPGQFGRQDCEP